MGVPPRAAQQSASGGEGPDRNSPVVPGEPAAGINLRMCRYLPCILPTVRETKLFICLEAFDANLCPRCCLVFVRYYWGYRVYADYVYAKDRQDFEGLAADRGQYSQTVKVLRQ